MWVTKAGSLSIKGCNFAESFAVLKINHGYRHLKGCVRHTPTTTKNSKKN